MILCDKDDLMLAGLIIEAYNEAADIEGRGYNGPSKKLDELEERIQDLTDGYGIDGNEPDAIEVPVELFHRLAAEVEHHKSMLDGKGAGIVVTLSGSTTGTMEYGVSKDIEFNFKIKVRAPEAGELTEAEIAKIYDCTLDAWRGTLGSQLEQFKDEVNELRSRVVN